MAKTWYPVIDYLVCAECGTCAAKCPHGVFDSAKAPSPVVKNPEACIDHCHNCGNRCPTGAITYVGDNTSWVPPHGTQKSKETGCSCEGHCC
ncbi:MAG TPA: 4Fe-4S ferredoxin [Ruminococcaceae bacterium]|jgi:NAD-dependent dihydropyrimidine dehydrogenase PreA subunit|nr:4Fe-4S ferredoxin [Oscillospiraceae bacterium]HCM23110.1 4Fe-4S ferredoxin [Oscillospiraceae bacterium]